MVVGIYRVETRGTGSSLARKSICTLFDVGRTSRVLVRYNKTTCIFSGLYLLLVVAALVTWQLLA